MNVPTTSWLNAIIILLDLAIVSVLVPKVILQRRESGATLAWILAIVFVPYIGLLSFWIFGTTRIRLRRRKRRRAEQHLQMSLARFRAQQKMSVADEIVASSLFTLAGKLGGAGPLPGCGATLYRDGRQAFDALEQAIDTASHHVHLVYYLWEPDHTGARLRDALTRAAGRQVEVRLLLDDVGSRRTKNKFFASLAAAGGEIARFLPVNPLNRQLALNNRNHRKLVVIDGISGFTGSMNVGDLYAGLAESWQDLHVHIRGPVVHELQEVFCQDWYHATARELASARYFPAIPPAGDICTQFLASGPADERWLAIHTLLFAAINLARERVWIETPYFVPDSAVTMALQTAALRGIDVRLLLPGYSDHPLVLLAGRSFYKELLTAGVRIFELANTIPHAKTAVIDRIFATTGSANMDQRSFRLNFEANLFFFGNEITSELEQDFLLLFREANEVTAADRANLTRSQRLAEGFARILAPLL